MKKRILVTGGAGFLGSHLCKILIDQGNKVICLDNFFTGREENIASFRSHEDFELIRHDITTSIRIEADEIYNLACPASPPHYQADPIRTTKINVLGSLNVLELAKEFNAKIFQASTSEVYGDPDIHPQKENYRGNVNPNGIRACYDEGKRCAESLFFDYKRQHSLNIRVARIFNTYGPNMNPTDGRVVSNFIVQALTGKPITIYGKGEQTRSFCYVDDLIDGFIRLMNAPDTLTGPVNLGNPHEITVLTLAEKILKMTSSKSQLIFKEFPQDDPVRRCPDITLAKNSLDWQPKISLEEGLEKTIKYFKTVLSQ